MLRCMYTNERISHKFFFFLSVSMSTVITVLSVGVAVCLFCLVCILCCARRGANANNRKKKHNFGVRKAAYFRVSGPIKLLYVGPFRVRKRERITYLYVCLFRL